MSHIQNYAKQPVWQSATFKKMQKARRTLQGEKEVGVGKHTLTLLYWDLRPLQFSKTKNKDPLWITKTWITKTLDHLQISKTKTLQTPLQISKTKNKDPLWITNTKTLDPLQIWKTKTLQNPLQISKTKNKDPSDSQKLWYKS